MHVTFEDCNVSYHGTIRKVDDGINYPIVAYFPELGEKTFTADGRIYRTMPVRLTIRMEL